MANILEQVIDFTPLIQLEETQPTLLSSLGLFDVQHHATTLVSIGRDTENDSLIPARERGGERNWLSMNKEKLAAVSIPFFPLDHNITAQDIQSFRTYMISGLDDNLRTEQEVVQRYLRKILRDQARTKEQIYAAAVQGYAYTGAGGSVNAAYNWYDVWGQTQQAITIDFTSATVDPTAVIEAEGRAYIEDSKGDGSNSTQLFALCGREFFAKLTRNAFVRSAYQFYQGTPNLLRDRISGNNDVQTFEFDGVMYMKDPYGFVASNEAYLFPNGIPNMFQAHYAPADHYQLANTVAQESYVFSYDVQAKRTFSLESEFSLLGVNTRPELVVKMTASA